MLTELAIQAVSDLTFTSSRRDDRAVQAVQVTKGSREQVFTFCLQRIEQGPYKVRALASSLTAG